MKRIFVSILSKPRIVIPVTFVIAFIIGVFVIKNVGNPPIVSNIDTSVDNSSSTPAAVNGNTLSLSFNASGRVATVSVALGDTVTQGEALATLDAGAAEGAVNQAKGALDMAKAQYGSLSVQYDNAKSDQDTLVNNAYRTLLSSDLQAIPFGSLDESDNPVISGTYTCDKEGSYEIDPYPSGAQSGYSFYITGLEQGSGNVTYGTPQPFGSCGLSITFVKGFLSDTKWTVSIPNTTSSVYQTNKNAYDAAVATHDQVLSQLSANLGENGTSSADTSSASIQTAEGTYEMALAQYQNSIIVAPFDGTVSFIDSGLKVGESVTAGSPVISIISH